MTLAARGRMLQCVVEKIGNGLLHFLVIEFENRQVAIQVVIQPDVLPHKRFMPSRRQFAQTIPQIILPQVQDELAAFQGRIIQEHRNQTNQPFAAFFRLLQNVALLVRQLTQRTR